MNHSGEARTFYSPVLYSEAEIAATEFFWLIDETVALDTSSTEYRIATACPVCGAGLRQLGPLLIGTANGPPPKRRLYCVSLMQSREWVSSTDIADLFAAFCGFHFGDVCEDVAPNVPLDSLKQIVIDNYLPRAARSSDFTEMEGSLKNRCSCNRGGWRLDGELIYSRAAVDDAKDFNLTVERFAGTRNVACSGRL